jgi:ribosomal protein S18 acetylase RimI-like enzyme
MANTMPPLPPKRRTVGALVGQSLEVLRSEGPIVLARRGLTRVGYLEAQWFHRDLEATASEEAPPDPGIEELDDAGVTEYVAWRPEIGAAHVRARLAAGASCSLVRVAGSPAASAWLSRGWAYVPYLGRRLALGPRDAYLFDLFTDVEHRRRGLQKVLLAHQTRRSVVAGATSLSALVETHNRSSRALFLGHGFRARGLLRCLRLVGGRAFVLGRPAASAAPWSQDPTRAR